MMTWIVIALAVCLLWAGIDYADRVKAEAGILRGNVADERED